MALPLFYRLEKLCMIDALSNRPNWNLLPSFSSWQRGISSAPSGANCGFKFQKRRQLFIRVHNEALMAATICVSNPDCSPVGFNR
jgi:hypothetical protein